MMTGMTTCVAVVRETMLATGMIARDTTRMTVSVVIATERMIAHVKIAREMIPAHVTNTAMKAIGIARMAASGAISQEMADLGTALNGMTASVTIAQDVTRPRT